MKKRDNYIDLLKGIAIFLVVLGHHDTVLKKYIYSFHMQLFFYEWNISLKLWFI